MKTTTKTFIALLGLAAITAGGSVYAQEGQKISQLDRKELRELRQSGDRDAFRQRASELGINRSNRPQLTKEQKTTIDALKESGDADAIKEQLDEWGIEKSANNRKGLRKENVFGQLTKEQKTEVQELRESGADKEVVREKLEEFGVKLPQRIELTDEQKEKIAELKEAGDREALKEYFEEIGLRKPRVFMQKRAEVINSLSDDEKELLQEARDIARAGDKETAKELLQDVFGDNLKEEAKERGIVGFFKRMFK